MKHKNFMDAYYRLNREALDDLKRCIEAHGGSYTFDEDADMRACITVIDEDYEGSGYVTKVEVSKDGVVFVTVVDIETGNNEYERLGDDLSISEMDRICNCLPEPKGTQPSTIKVSDIVWETDGEDVDLPDEMEIPSDIEKDEIEGYLSNETGFLVLSYCID